MLTQLQIFGLQSSPPVLPFNLLGDPGTDPIQIRGIDGLGPVKADITTTPFGSVDGEAFVGGTVGKRNIILKFGLNPNWVDQTMESLRQLLYQYFMPKMGVRLRFISTHLPDCEIAGYVESMEPNIFSKDPEIAISVICPRPVFIAVDSVTIEGVAGIAASSEFEEFTYEGTVPTGMILDVVVPTSAMGTYAGDLWFISEAAGVPSAFRVNDVVLHYDDNVLRMSSIPGSKFIQSIDTLTSWPTNLLVKVPLTSIWPILWPKVNKFRVYGEVPGVEWSLTYSALFGGL